MHKHRPDGGAEIDGRGIALQDGTERRQCEGESNNAGQERARKKAENIKRGGRANEEAEAPNANRSPVIWQIFRVCGQVPSGIMYSI